MFLNVLSHIKTKPRIPLKPAINKTRNKNSSYIPAPIASVTCCNMVFPTGFISKTINLNNKKYKNTDHNILSASIMNKKLTFTSCC